MAMTECGECGRRVSAKAYKCIGCGDTLRTPKRGFFGSLFMAIFILFNAIMAWMTWTAVSIASGGYGQSTAYNVGEGMAIGFIITVWVVIGLFLGLFVMLTRPKAQ